MTSSLSELAIATEQDLWEIKLAHRPESFWYPYDTLRLVGVLETLLANAGLDLMKLCRGPYGKIADIGGGDGDLAFFLEKIGLSVDLIDNEPTNFNHLEGARILKKTLHSNVTIRTVDLDAQFTLHGEKYNAIFFLGVLYHLRNPFFVLEKLAALARYCFLSTRITRQTHNGRQISQEPVAYLLGPQECNNDNTNFWIFSDEGLKRLINRTGWSVLSYLNVGATANSTPADPERDARAFCLLRSEMVPTITASSNPVSSHKDDVSSMISWTTGTATPGNVYVSIDGQEELLFATSPQGSAPANWIQTGHTYEFRLYDSDRRLTAVDKTEVTTPITGKIDAKPNPICFGQRCVITWNTNDPMGAEVRVSTGSSDEELVTQGGNSGSVEIPWITDSRVYEFRLYPASRPDLALDSVKARREIESVPAVLRDIADEVTRGNVDMAELWRFIAAVMPFCLESPEVQELFQNRQRHGFHT
jgi:tRNA (mo5U34)-methyltransferase